MKDLGLMHYYLGLEVWKKCGEVFLGQGKYTIKILQKFGMMKCKSMDTPMNADIRKVKLPDSNPVDPSLYRQLIGSLMYLVNTTIYFLYYKYIKSVLGGTYTRPLDSYKECHNIYSWDNKLWLEIYCIQ
jgi:hypothetical protein